MKNLLLVLFLIALINCQEKKTKTPTDVKENQISNELKESKTEDLNNATIDKDSVKIIASMFLYENIDSLKYYLEEPDIYKVYQKNKYWVKTYFPEILNTYELKYFQKLNIAYYLYLVGQTDHLRKLAKKENLSTEETRVLNWYIENYNLEID